MHGLQLKSLEYRSFIADVTFLCKILNSYRNLNIISYSLDDQYSLRGFEWLKLRKNYAWTANCKFSSSNRIVDSWNSLPSGVRFSYNLFSFKRNVRIIVGLAVFLFSYIAIFDFLIF